MRIGTIYQAPSKVKIINPFFSEKIDYHQYILSKDWKRKKKNLIKNWQCKVCGCRKRKWLNVHHLHYRNLGNEKENDLMVLCQRCHLIWHEEKKRISLNPSIEHIKSLVLCFNRQKELDKSFELALQNNN